jgi:hypothetical protein
MPRLAAALLLVLLVALAGSLSYVGYLVIGVIADYLEVGRLLAGVLIGVLFARFPWVRAGKLRTVGLLPKRARLPVMATLLAFCMLHYFYRGEWIPLVFLGFAEAFLLMYPWLKSFTVRRATSLFKASVGPSHAESDDGRVIDVEVRERKD